MFSHSGGTLGRRYKFGMGFFDRIFGRKSRKIRRWTSAANAKLQNPAMLVLLDAPPVLDAERAIRDLAAIETLAVVPRFSPRDLAATSKTAFVAFSGAFEFDSHSIDVAGIDAPVAPEIVDRTVTASHWTGEGREGMEKHRAHVQLTHRGGGANPAEKYIALYKLAAALGGEHLAGVLIDEAWTCAPAGVVREFARPAFLKTIRDQAPPILFTGFVKFMGEDGTWFATKGQHVFGSPDFVMQAGPGDRPDKTLDLFMNIFLYIASADRELRAGHTMQIAQDIFLRFGELPADHPHAGALKGAGRTLTIARIGKDEINTREPDGGAV